MFLVVAGFGAASVFGADFEKKKEKNEENLPKVTGCGHQYFGDPKTPGKNGKPFDAYKPVVLKIVEPSSGQTYAADKTKIGVKFRLENYDLAPGGNHLHLIVDNLAYQAVYNVGEPFYIEVKPGAHMLRAFASRPWHESFKNKEAFAWCRFVVGADDGKFKVNPQGPVLTYSRPKGSYTIGSTADEVIFDFWACNIDWKTQNAIALITGPDGKKVWDNKFSKWESKCIKGKFKTPGEYKVSFKLINKKSKLLLDNGGVNSVERVITIQNADASKKTEAKKSSAKPAAEAKPAVEAKPAAKKEGS